MSGRIGSTVNNVPFFEKDDNSKEWISYNLANYVESIQQENQKLRDAGNDIVNHIMSNKHTLTSRELLVLCNKFVKLTKKS